MNFLILLIFINGINHNVSLLGIYNNLFGVLFRNKGSAYQLIFSYLKYQAYVVTKYFSCNKTLNISRFLYFL